MLDKDVRLGLEPVQNRQCKSELISYFEPIKFV